MARFPQKHLPGHPVNVFLFVGAAAAAAAAAGCTYLMLRSYTTVSVWLLSEMYLWARVRRAAD